MPVFDFKQRSSSEWHRKIDIIANGQHPSTPAGGLNPSFPWDQLQQHTAQYLKKKGKLSLNERDNKLACLVRDHIAKDVAMAACAHSMSPKCINNMIRGESNCHLEGGLELYYFLQTLVAASYWCPEAIEIQEAQRARLLIPYCSCGSSVGASHFQPLMSLLKDAVPTFSILFPHTEALARRACISFVAKLETMRIDSLWLKAYALTEWLPTLSGVPLQLSPESDSLLQATFPTWRIWASWKPSEWRLQLWNQITNLQALELRDLLALEGPDFTESGKSTLWEGLITTRRTSGSRFTIDRGNIHIELNASTFPEAHYIMARLLRAVDNAIDAGSDQIDLVVHFCVGTTLDSTGLHILELIHQLKDAATTTALLQVHKAIAKGREEQLAALIELLPTLDNLRAKGLRDVLSPYLLDSIMCCLQDMQMTLGEVLTAGNVWDASKLLVFGQGLKEITWIQPLFSASLNALLNTWPTNETIKSIQGLRLTVSTIPNDNPLFMTKLIDEYCLDALVSPGSMQPSRKSLAEEIIGFWERESNCSRRSIAVVITGGSSIEPEYICKILTKLPTLPYDFVKRLWEALQLYYEDVDKDLACVSLAKLLSSTHLFDAIGTWKPVLSILVGQRDQLLLDFMLKSSDTKVWIQWLVDLRSIYGHGKTLDPSTPILWQRLIEWGQELEEHLPAIIRLQKTVESEGWIQCIKVGSSDDFEEALILTILDVLRDHTEERYQQIFCTTLSMLEADGSNIELISEVLCAVTTSTPPGTEACRRVLDLTRIASAKVAEAFLALYRNSAEMTRADVTALNVLAKLLGLYLDPCGNVPDTSLDAVTDYLVAQIDEIYKEARRLENLRVAYKAAAPEATAALLESLGIEDSTPAQDALSHLPTALVDLVELVGDQEIEMQIPLDLTPLQRVALGVGTASNITFRLNLPESNLPLAFCLHLDDETKTNDNIHRPWMVSDGNRPPAVPVCFGRPNRALYQLSRALFRYLRKGYGSLAEVHNMIITTLKELPNHCMVCGVHIGTKLRRSTVCSSAECSKIFERARPAIRLSDIRDDHLAMDAILTFVYAAAASSKAELLPGCPISNCQTVKQVLNLIPTVAQLKNTTETSLVLKKHPQAEELLSWAANSYRGFFTSAVGHLRIPGMANAHQFILASAAPELEVAFAAQVALNGGTTKIVFHSTKLDRVFSILTQGLRVHSATDLMRTGAAYGHGIYVTENPQVASQFLGAAQNAAGMWTGATMKDVRVLLGCELAGTGTVPPGQQMHVVTNPAQLMVRHVFLLGPTAQVPTLATHVTPAMGSVFSFLRSAAP